MAESALEKELYEKISQLSIEQQRQVLDFARALVSLQVHGVPGRELSRFAGAIDAEDIKAMEKAIKDGCEKVNRNEW